MRYKCEQCGWVGEEEDIEIVDRNYYDPPEWRCPKCGAYDDMFEEEEE